MRLLPTGLGAKGALFFATVLLLFYATPYSNLFFLLTAFLLVLGGLGVAGAATNLRGIDARLDGIARAPAGSAHAVALRLQGRRRTSFGLSIELELGARRLAIAAPLVAAPGEVVTGQLAGLPRGVHEVTAVLFSSRHPFGICRACVRRPVQGLEVVAHPVPAALGRHGSAGDAPGDDGGFHLAGGDQEVAGLRDYRPGDALRDVHWKATARRGEIVVKERHDAGGDGLVLVLDRRAPAAAFEEALSLCTALLLRAAAGKQALELRSQGHVAVYGQGRQPFAQGLRWLAAAAALPQSAPPPPPGPRTALRLPRPHRGRAAAARLRPEGGRA